jgi:hypothetical protein
MDPHVEQTCDDRVLMVMSKQLGSIHMSESSLARIWIAASRETARSL